MRRLTDELQAEHNQLDVLVNNAGIGAGRRGETSRQLSQDGHELRFAVNYLAPFLLTRRLLPLLRLSAPARVVNVASAGQSPIDFEDVMLERGYDGMRAYAQSKLAQVMFTFDLAGKLQGTGVTVNCLHPASLLNTILVFKREARRRATCKRAPMRRSIWPLPPTWRELWASYFDGRREARADEQAYDPEARDRLRWLSEELISREKV